MRFVAKIVMLIFNDTEEKAVEKAIAALADNDTAGTMQPPHSPVLTFPGLEIKIAPTPGIKKRHRHSPHTFRVRRTLLPCHQSGRVFTKAQIFEAVWSLESESCQSNVANVICNLRKKIEPDSGKPTYIKTVLGVGYKFASGE